MKITYQRQCLQAWGMYLLLTAFMLLTPQDLLAEGLVGGLKNISKTVQDIVNIVFTIGISVGLVAVILDFVGDNPNKIKRLIYLIIAVLLWFGFTFVFEQIQNDVGGTGGFKAP